MPLVDLPADAALDAPSGAALRTLPAEAQLDAPQVSGWLRYPALAGSAFAKGAITGAGAISDLGDFLQGQANRGLIDPLRHAVGLSDPVVPRSAAGTEMTYPGAAGLSLSQLFPGAAPEQLPEYLKANRDWLGTGPMQPSLASSTNLLGLGRSAGVVDRPDLTPQNTGERYLAAGAEGAGGMLPYLPLSAGGALANAVRGALTGAAIGTGGEAATDIASKYGADPNNPWARAGGSIAGGLTAGGALGALNRVLGATTGTATPVMQAYRDLKIDPALAGDVTGTPLLQQVQAFAAKAPGGAGRIQNTSERAIGQWGNALEDTAHNLGGARTAQEAGTALQMEGQGWLNNFKQDSTKAWNEVDMHIPQSTPVPATNYATTLSNIQNSMPGAPATAQVLQSPLGGKLLNSLIADIQKGPLSWQDIRGIRTRIGEKLAEPQLVGDTSYTELKRLYGALTSDIESVVTSRGPAAQKAFADASALTRDGHDFIENTLSNVLRGKQIAPETAAQTALGSGGSGGTLLQDIRDRMPAAADELAAYKLRNMGLARPGQQTGTLDRLSPNTFLTDRARLAPEAFDALFADPYTAQRLRDLSTVAGSMRATERFLNTSNTATAQMMGQALGVAAPAAAVGGFLQGGLPGLAVGAGSTLSPWIAGNLASRAVTSPTLTRLMAAPPAVPTPSAGLLAGGALYPQLRGLLGP